MGRSGKVQSLGLDAEGNVIAGVSMLPARMVDLRDLHFLAPVESEAGSSPLQAQIRLRAGIQFDGLT